MKNIISTNLKRVDLLRDSSLTIGLMWRIARK